MTEDRRTLDFNNVELLRKHMAINTTNMAELLNISRVCYYKWKNGESTPRPIRARKANEMLRKLFTVVEQTSWPTEEVMKLTNGKRMKVLREYLKNMDSPAVVM